MNSGCGTKQGYKKKTSATSFKSILCPKVCTCIGNYSVNPPMLLLNFLRHRRVTFLISRDTFHNRKPIGVFLLQLVKCNSLCWVPYTGIDKGSFVRGEYMCNKAKS